MAIPIDQSTLINLVNNQGSTPGRSNLFNTSTQVASSITGLSDILFNNTINATVSNSNLTPDQANTLINLLQSQQSFSAANTTTQNLNPVAITLPQSSELPAGTQIILSTNQTALQPGQNIQVQVPDLNSFSRINANNIVGNVNIVVSNPQTQETQTFNARLLVVAPALNVKLDVNLNSNQFIQQDLSNPNNLLGRDYSAFFIQKPTQQTANLLPAELLKPISQLQDISGLQIQINNISLPNSGDSINKSPNGFYGSVLFTGDDETILNTNIGTLRLPVNLSLPLGTELDFNISAINLKNSGSIPDININNIEALKQYINSDDTVLKDLLSALSASGNVQGAQGSLAAANIANQLPGVTDKFIMARALWFLGNVANLSPSTWLNEDIKNSLKRNNADDSTIGKLEGLFKTLRNFFVNNNDNVATQQGWNNYIVPFMDSDNNLNYVSFYTEKESSNAADLEKGKALRFVVELNNSYYGDVQIDGLLSKNKNNSKVLDVFFRYSGDVSEEDRANIRDIFTNTLAASDVKGEIIFQQMPVDEIPRPYAESSSATHNLYTI